MTDPLYRLNIVKQVTAQIVDGRTQGYRVVLEATSLSGFRDGGVFLFIRNGQEDLFQSVCSVADMSDYNLNSPDPAEGWVRLNKIDLVFASPDILSDTLEDLLADVKILCQEMSKVAVDLTVGETIVVDSSVV